jgi:hypothetical protein
MDLGLSTYELKVRYATYTRGPNFATNFYGNNTEYFLYYGKEPKVLGGADNTM